MKTANELYPEYLQQEQQKKWFYGPYDYQPILEEIGNILIQVDDKDYQGDSRILYEKNGQFGILIFGWGSCSGCDALQGCNNMAEIQKLIDNLINDVKWFNSIAELYKYVSQKDWNLEYSWHIDETKDFIQKVLSYCSNH